MSTHAERTVLTTWRTRHGTGPTLALTRETDGSYRVGTLGEDGTIASLGPATFRTYSAAYERLKQEAWERRH